MEPPTLFSHRTIDFDNVPIVPASTPVPLRPPSLKDAAPVFSHAECLRALWKLSTQNDLDEDTRIRAVLRMATEALGMDVAILGKSGRTSAQQYVYDPLKIVSENGVLQLHDALSSEVYETRTPRHIPDLSAHPELKHHQMVTEAGLQVFSGVPINTGEETDWVLAFLRRSASPPLNDEQIIYIELIADWLGNALHHSEQKALLQRLALTDILTELPNRRAAEDRLQQELARAQRRQEGFALAMVDLDHFRYVNERYGHSVGDQVLKEISKRLLAGLRDCDWVARWCGEKFLFFLHDSSAREAVSTLERLTEEIKTHPVNTSIGAIPLTLSAGIGVVHKGRYDVQRALDMADISLRRAKNAGRDKVHALLDPNTGWSIQTVKNAVTDNRLRLSTQVIVDLDTGLTVADESLARLVTQEGELVEAEKFIGMAEGLGIIADLDQHMAQLSMQRCKARLDQGGSPGFSHFINLSPQFLARRGMVDQLLETAQSFAHSCGINEQGVNPLVLEITERQLIGNLNALREDLQPLLNFGFRLALDDFGSGYSSFIYLASLPISFLKIEGWLVLNMQRDHKIATIVESMVTFARKEGIQTIAEHVEDAHTARILRDIGVDWGQGWYFGRPEASAIPG